MEPGSAKIVAEGLGWVTVQAEGPGWLVTIRPWYPGWAATADGQALTVEPVDGALVGVALGPGQQTVTLRYWPAGLSRGLGLSVLAGICLAVLWWLGRRGHHVRSKWHGWASF